MLVPAASGLRLTPWTLLKTQRDRAGNPSSVTQVLRLSLSPALPSCLFFFFFFFNDFSIIFIYFFAALGLHCFVQAFSSCSERGLLFVAVLGLLIAVACCGAQALGARASVVAAYRFGSCVTGALERRFSSCGTRA